MFKRLNDNVYSILKVAQKLFPNTHEFYHSVHFATITPKHISELYTLK